MNLSTKPATSPILGPEQDADEIKEGAPSLYARAAVRLVHNPNGVIGLVIVASLFVVGVLGPLIAPHDPLEVGAGEPFMGPSRSHLLGTDNLGRDLFSRLLFGARISLQVAVMSSILAVVMAAPLGVIAGFCRGIIDSAISRLFDTIFAFPPILVGVALAALFGGGPMSVVISVATINIPTLGRLIRVGVMSESEETYVLAARSLGATAIRIIARHILPNVLPGLFVQLALIMGQAILLEATFSFLGLGSKPPAPSWGIILNEGRRYLSLSPWLGIFAGVAITLLVFGFNSLGDGLQKALNPHLVNQ